MPLYDYHCNKCKVRFEHLHLSHKEEPLKTCPDCGGEVRKLISTQTFKFRGFGFYTTDYRSKDYKEKAKAEKESSTPAASKKDKTPAGKPDAPRAGKDKSEKKNKQKSGS